MAKKNHTMHAQLSLFGDNRITTIPDMNFDERIRSVTFNNEVYFSLLDILLHYGSDGSAKNPAIYWKRAKDRLDKQGSEVITLVLSHRFAGQGQRDTPIVNLEAFLRIAQVVDIRQWESIRAWMAKSSAKKIKDTREERTFIQAKMDQGMSLPEATDFVRQAMVSRDTRNDWAAAFKAAIYHAITGKHYAIATDTEYVKLFGKSAKEIRDITGFDTARDGMTTEGRSILNAVEASLEKMFRKYEGSYTFDQALGVVRQVCAAYSVSVQNVEALLGISLATGRPLIGGGR